MLFNSEWRKLWNERQWTLWNYIFTDFFLCFISSTSPTPLEMRERRSLETSGDFSPSDQRNITEDQNPQQQSLCNRAADSGFGPKGKNVFGPRSKDKPAKILHTRFVLMCKKPLPGVQIKHAIGKENIYYWRPHTKFKQHFRNGLNHDHIYHIIIINMAVNARKMQPCKL